MKKTVLICFGKLKTPGMENAVAEFTKRLGPYTKFSCIELKSTQSPEKDESLVLDLLESQSFQTHYARNPQIWALDETGKALKTTEWSSAFKEIQNHGSGELVLIIGGSYGLGDQILNKAHKKISFGPQTFSHELARLVLIEQLYRVLSFGAGHPYHHEG
jgi:23S rRNA (pseudouridine1915-N3)-methyltransferase